MILASYRENITADANMSTHITGTEEALLLLPLCNLHESKKESAICFCRHCQKYTVVAAAFLPWICLSENRQHCGVFLPRLFYIHNVCFAIQADFSVYKTVYDCKLLLHFLELLRICAR